MLLRAAPRRLLRGRVRPTFTPGDENPEDFPAGAGRDETFYACTACHNFKLVAAQGLTRAGWEDSINLMVRRHNMPPLDGKDREVVLNLSGGDLPAPRTGGRTRLAKSVQQAMSLSCWQRAAASDRAARRSSR